MVPNYWRSVAHRAFFEAAAALGITSRKGLVLWLVAAIVAITALLLWGNPGAAWDDLVWRLAIIAVIGSLFPFIFLWRVISLPAEMSQEQSAENTLLRGALGEKAGNIARTRVLTVLWEQGLEFIVEDTTIEKLPDWLVRLDKWEKVTLKYLASMFSHQDAVAFRVVEFNPKVDVPRKANDEHAGKFIQTSTRCQRLKAIIDRHVAVWSPISAREREAAMKDLADFEEKVFRADGDKALK